MIVQTTATGRDRAACGPVRWVIVTTIGWTALMFLGALWASFTALADLAERGGIEPGQAGWSYKQFVRHSSVEHPSTTPGAGHER